MMSNLLPDTKSIGCFKWIKIWVLYIGVGALFNGTAYSQHHPDGCESCPSALELTAAKEQTLKNPSASLDAGVSLKDGKIVLSPEGDRLLKDSLYRSIVYAMPYTFNSLSTQLKEGNMLLALWHLVNLYQQNPKVVVDIVQRLNKITPMKQYFINAFYTYIFFDPEVVKFDKGRPVFVKPERMEEKLKICRHLASIQ